MDKKSTEINVLWALLCESATVDQQTNTLSIFKVIEELTVSNGPISTEDIKAGIETTDFETTATVNSKGVLVAQIQRGSEFNSNLQTQMKLEVFDPVGACLITHEFPLDFGPSASSNKTRAIVNFDGMLVSKTGKYIYRLSTKVTGEKDFTKKFDVQIDVKIAK